MSREATFTSDHLLAEKAVSTEANGDLIVEGYAATWDVDRQGEAFDPGSFGEAIKSFLSGAAPFLYQHKDGQQLGRVEHLEERPQGLWMRARVPKPPEGAPLRHQYDLLKRGMLRGASVRGKVMKLVEGAKTRLRMQDLYEISSTPAPVNAGGLVAVAAKALEGDTEGDIEDAEIDEAGVREYLNERLAAASAELDAVEERLQSQHPVVSDPQ